MVRGPRRTGNTDKIASPVRRLEKIGGLRRTRGTGKQVPVTRDLEGGRKTKESLQVAALLSSWSDCWQVVFLAIACFKRCFFFFYHFFFFLKILFIIILVIVYSRSLLDFNIITLICTNTPFTEFLIQVILGIGRTGF